MSAPLSIDRLTLHAGPMSESDARRLAELVGQALGRIPDLPASAGGVTVSMPSQPGRSVEQLAVAVVHAIESALRVEGAR